MVALDIAMGMCHKLSLKLYFSSYTSQGLNSTPNYSEVMSRDKYFLLRAFLDFNDNGRQIPRGEPGYDPLFEIRPIN